MRQFGVNAIAQSALESPGTITASLRKIADRFEQPHGLELPAHLWASRPKELRAPVAASMSKSVERSKMLTWFILTKQASNATVSKRDSDVFRTSQHTLYAVRESRGGCSRGSPRRGLRGTVICDGWTVYPAFSSNLQRCWAHILVEAKDAAEKTQGRRRTDSPRH